ncbi:hypothetical protein EJ06DRAFT_84151 [Trichodelitschia bisporula]|uniref:F-box domain-containing protein n=1 Tax=Trichodelitschia bisporula TaxID=703511 RepID=A0A6G1HRW1_9PEZI|nr:hypothetical protein EJ06DRAFT_84151 [Trichodelitschia bisporula]
MLPLNDWPLDILTLITPYLPPASLLALSATCRALYTPAIRDDASYWRHLTLDTYRVRDKPAAAANGPYWERLFRRLRTQSRVYTWGGNQTGLGRPADEEALGAVTADLGVVADLQCGGWCTAVLNVRGEVWLTGALNGMLYFSLHYGSTKRPLWRRAEVPPVRQMSVGRKHVLMLCDDGSAWAWVGIRNEDEVVRVNHRARTVVAGWDRSSARVEGGIAVWSDENSDKPHELIDADADTHILLEHFVVFLSDGQLFASRVPGTPFALPLPPTLDVQGSFRRFGVFTKSGAVLVLEQAFLEAFEAGQPPPEPWTIPALQNTGVLTLAFGDYHFHALHADGTISSYGTEPQDSEALGLGLRVGVKTIRGMEVLRNGDCKLLPQTYWTGRRVYFNPHAEKWLQHMATGGADPGEMQPRFHMTITTAKPEVSEWIERQLRTRFGPKDEWGSWFAIGVAAAGWHSAALVLVDGEGVDSENPADFIKDTFPRLVLADGTEMPGTAELQTVEMPWLEA